MNTELGLAVSMSIDGKTQVSCTVDELNKDATFVLVGAQGFESYLMLDSDALQRFHEMTGAALDELRTERPGPWTSQNGCRPQGATAIGSENQTARADIR